MDLSPRTAERLARGRELFNAGLYFEAHEAWEDVWRAETGPVRLTLHGLIQIAAGFHKATRQNQPSGCVRLLESGLEKLRNVPEDSCGLSLGEFRQTVVEALAVARRWLAGEQPDPRRELRAELKPATAGSEGRG